jgi:aminoglycoside 6'-N-acetyltransferase I
MAPAQRTVLARAGVNAEVRMNTVERRVRAMINPWSTALTRWWCHSAARFALTGYGAPRGRGHDVPRPTPAVAPADGMPQAVRIEPLTQADVAFAVELAVRVLRVEPGDRSQQFASDITDELRQMFVAKANGQVVGYGRVIELATGEAGPGTPAGCYLGGVLVDPAWRDRGIATALTRARLRWALARTDTVFYVAGADNAASLHLHAGLGFEEVKRFGSDRSATGVDVLSQLVKSTAPYEPGPLPVSAPRHPG